MSDKRMVKIRYEQTEQDEIRVEEPSMYHVLLLNDDYTTMEFVVSVIRDMFHQSIEQASRIMMEVHTKGKGIAGTYTRDIARTKAETVMHLAFEENYPLKCIIEKA